MTDNDEMLRAYSLLTALKANLPNTYKLEERWIREYHNALAKLERSSGRNLADFKLSEGDLCKSIAGGTAETEDHPYEVTYKAGLYCKRNLLLQKLDAILTYFTVLQTPEEKTIGF